MRYPFRLKPRSSFPDFYAAKRYAEEARGEAFWASWFVGMAVFIDSLTAMYDIADLDPTLHTTGTNIGFAIGGLAISQALYARSVAGDKRSNETWQDFHTARDREQERAGPRTAAQQAFLDPTPAALPDTAESSTLTGPDEPSILPPDEPKTKSDQ